MKFETLRNNRKILLITVVVFFVTVTLIISTSLAKYKVTESIKIASGTINYTPYDVIVTTKLLIDEDKYIELDEIPSSSTISITSSTCTNNASISLSENTYLVTNLTLKGTKCEVIYAMNSSTSFDYSGNIEEYTVTETGTYKLEVWGAQGGSTEHGQTGGYGGYSVGEVSLTEGDILYIGIGGKGQTVTTAETSIDGGYNGGGSASTADSYGTNSYGSGGGATHIATKTGLLSTLSSNLSDILIIAGGGGGSAYYYNSTEYSHYGSGGHGGGFEGVDAINTYSSTQTHGEATGGTQSLVTTTYTKIINGSFGQGANGTEQGYAGGGGGYYGGSSSFVKGSGGGSGYIANSNLINKKMVCYNCETSDAENTLTYSVDTTSENAKMETPKIGNGYAKITNLNPEYYKPNFDIEVTNENTSITITITPSSDNLFETSKYYYSINDEFIESTTNTYTFSDLEYKTYTIKAYIVDSKNITSEVQTKTISIEEGITAQDIIASKTISTRTDFSTTQTTDTTGTIYQAKDDDGDSYYYAGAPTDNWVKFAGFYWRIIRINGDGTIRMIYQGTSANNTGTGTQLSSTSAFNSSYNNNMYVGYMYASGSVHGLGTSSTVKGVLENWYSTNLANFASYIDVDAGFCGDRTSYTDIEGSTSGGGTGSTTTYYGAYVRLNTNKSPSLKCTNSSDLYTTANSSKGNKAVSNPIGLITADEVAYAGGVYNKANTRYYLYTGEDYWTITPDSSDGSYASVWSISYEGKLAGHDVDLSCYTRPVINLRADTVFENETTGTSSNPYVVVGAE